MRAHSVTAERRAWVRITDDVQAAVEASGIAQVVLAVIDDQLDLGPS